MMRPFRPKREGTFEKQIPPWIAILGAATNQLAGIIRAVQTKLFPRNSTATGRKMFSKSNTDLKSSKDLESDRGKGLGRDPLPLLCLF